MLKGAARLEATWLAQAASGLRWPFSPARVRCALGRPTRFASISH